MTRPLNLHGVNVLIVEDDLDSAEMLQQMVASFGATVVTAKDGHEAVAAALVQRPDLILCDLLMPEMNGYQFVEWLRERPTLSRVPVIAVTALGMQVDYMRTWSAGFSGHLLKPIDYETIRAQLERVFWAHH